MSSPRLDWLSPLVRGLLMNRIAAQSTMRNSTILQSTKRCNNQHITQHNHVWPTEMTNKHTRSFHHQAAKSAHETSTASESTPTPANSSAESSSSSKSTNSSSSPLVASRSALAAEARFLYRFIHRHIRLLPNEDRRLEGLVETRRQFRENMNESDVQVIRKQIENGYSKLSFMRMATPRLYHPPIRTVPPYHAARTLLGLTKANNSAGTQSYRYFGGEILSGDFRDEHEINRVVNSQGITDEQIKRHYALVDRMHFRGPHWAGKPKY